MTDAIASQLHDLLANSPAPILFVGAGLSRRYSQSDDWEGLLRHFSSFTDQPYEYYKSNADGSPTATASAIAESFRHVWWKRDEFQESREKWSNSLVNRESPLKVEVANRFSKLHTTLPEEGEMAEEISLLKEAVIDAVVTTNSDSILETVFPDFRLFVGQEELLFSSPQGIGEIYAIHGHHSRPDSVILTADDYSDFDTRNAYLAAKLLTMFVEHPIIFVGYSIQDPNVIAILRAITNCLSQDNINKLGERLIFVQWDAQGPPSLHPYSLLLDGSTLNVRRLTTHEFKTLFTVLGQLKRQFPAHLLRKLKEQVYELVVNGDKNGRLYVANIDEDTNPEDIDVVFGVGMRAELSERGYKGIDRRNIIDDVLGSETQRYDARRLIFETLPLLLRGNANVPVYKYLRQAGYLDTDGSIVPDHDLPPAVVAMADKIREGLSTGISYERRAPQILASVDSLSDLETKLGTREVFLYGIYLEDEKLDPDELREFLERNQDPGNFEAVQYSKLACRYDFLISAK